MNFAPKTPQWILFGLCVLVQTGFWIASADFFGEREPWDSKGFNYYCGGLFFCGLVAGFVMPRFFWLSALGIWVGQMIGFLSCVVTSQDGIGSMAVPGFLFAIPLFSLLGLLRAGVGAGAGAIFYWLLGRQAV